MKSIVVAIIDCFSPSILEKLGTKFPSHWTISAVTENTVEARLSVLKKADITLMMAAKLDRYLLDSAPNLIYVQKMGAGVDNIDVDYCKENNIGVARLDAGNHIPVAEHTVMMILAATRRLVDFDHQTRMGIWGKEIARGTNKQVHGKTIGIIGLGAIGRRVAHLLHHFGAELIYCDPVPAPHEMTDHLGLRQVSLEELISLADIITLHLPLNTETSGLISAIRIKSMKPGSILINCARGGLVDENALAMALENGHLFAAAVDTFSIEPVIDSPLLNLETAILSPHCAGATFDNFDSIAERSIMNAVAFINNEPLPEKDLVYDPRFLSP